MSYRKHALAWVGIDNHNWGEKKKKTIPCILNIFVSITKQLVCKKKLFEKHYNFQLLGHLFIAALDDDVFFAETHISLIII